VAQGGGRSRFQITLRASERRLLKALTRRPSPRSPPAASTPIRICASQRSSTPPAWCWAPNHSPPPGLATACCGAGCAATATSAASEWKAPADCRAGVTRQLIEAGIEVLEAERPNRSDRRLKGSPTHRVGP
jgi:hypothetical protein